MLKKHSSNEPQAIMHYGYITNNRRRSRRNNKKFTLILLSLTIIVLYIKCAKHGGNDE